jgi:acyl transferase domain-containing protein
MSKPVATSTIHAAEISQPAVTALQIALVSLLESWGVRPSAVCGHSSGEFAAAYTAGAIDLRTCMALASYGGTKASALKKSQKKSGKIFGAMMTIGSGPELVEPLLESLQCGFAIIACYNSPESVTVSGDGAAIEELSFMLKESGTFFRMLKVDVAYHSGGFSIHFWIYNVAANIHRSYARCRTKLSQRRHAHHGCMFRYKHTQSNILLFRQWESRDA